MLSLQKSGKWYALKGRIDGKQKGIGIGVPIGASDEEIMRGIARKLNETPSLKGHLTPALQDQLNIAIRTDENISPLLDGDYMWSDALALYSESKDHQVSATELRCFSRLEHYIRQTQRSTSPLVDIKLTDMNAEFWDGLVTSLFKEPVLNNGKVRIDRGKPVYRLKAKPSSVSRFLSPIKAAYNMAKDKYDLRSFPKLNLPPVSYQERAYATPEMFAKIVREAEADMRYHYMLPVLYLHFYTGCRTAELVRLMWSKEDAAQYYDRDEAKMNYLITDDDDWKIVMVSKVHAGRSAREVRRVLNVHPKLKEVLQRFNNRYQGHVVRNRSGERFSYGYDEGKDTGAPYKKPFATLRDRARLPKSITPYSFRHGFASQLAKKTDAWTLQNAMGHTNIRTTQRYVHSDEAVASVTNLL